MRLKREGKEESSGQVERTPRTGTLVGGYKTKAAILHINGNNLEILKIKCKGERSSIGKEGES